MTKRQKVVNGNTIYKASWIDPSDWYKIECEFRPQGAFRRIINKKPRGFFRMLRGLALKKTCGGTACLSLSTVLSHEVEVCFGIRLEGLFNLFFDRGFRFFRG